MAGRGVPVPQTFVCALYPYSSSIGRGPPELAYALCTSLVLIMDKNEKLMSWKKGQQNHFPD